MGAVSGPALRLTPYRLGLRRPLIVGGVTLDAREGLIVTLTDADGAVGHGDAAPLPGLHPESLAEVRAWLGTLSLDDFESVSELRTALLQSTTPVPTSAWFALESAWVRLEAAKAEALPAALMCEAPLAEIRLNALFDGDPADARAAIESGRYAGYGAVKVKIGRRAPDDERALLDILLEGLAADTLLRLDANRALPLDAAVSLCAGLDPARIEYVEEPVASPDDLVAFSDRTGLPLALDETLYTPQAGELVTLPCVRTLVLKPALRGGVLETLADAERADRMGKEVVVTSCFESGLGLAFLVQLAAAVHSEGVAAGLATDRWLASDVLEPAFDSRAGVIRLDDHEPAVLAELNG